MAVAYTPVSGTVPQYQVDGNTIAAGYFLKGYTTGTTTPLSMATDVDGGTLIAKCKLNTQGYPLSNPSDDTTVFIPHFNQEYKLALYTNATDADNNTTANADWVVDKISPFNPVGAVTASDGDATPTVLGVGILTTGNTSATTITDFDDAHVGQQLLVIINDGFTTFDFTSSALNTTGNGEVNWIPVSGDSLKCVYDGASWWCTPSVSIMNEIGIADPTKFQVYFNDFFDYDANFWVVTSTEAGSGSATETIVDATERGVLQLLCDDADNDNTFMQFAGNSGGAASEHWKFNSGKRFVFKCRVSMDDVDQTSMFIGLHITDTTPGLGGGSVSDGVMFFVDDNDADGTVGLRVRKDDTQTVTSSIATMVDATMIIFTLIYDGGTVLQHYVDDVLVGTSVTTNLPDDEELAISFGVQNGEAAANRLKIDYIHVVSER